MTRTETQDGFAIGTVAGLTGVDVHTIRAWERRYAAIQPDRTQTGHRRYGEPQIQRLHLLRAVTDLGEPIGTVAGLDDDSLRQRLQRLSTASTPESAAPCSVAVVGRHLAEQMAAAGSPATAGWDLVATAADLDDLPVPIPSVVIVHADRLAGGLLDRLDAARTDAPGTQWVVVYEFARRAELLALARRGIRAVKGPLRIEALQRTVADLQLVTPPAPHALPDWSGRGEAPPRHIDDAQLARLRELVGTVACECPTHLASIVSTLNSFEDYARHCESQSPEDAELHRRLAEGTGRARAVMERLLTHVCAADGIRI